MALHLRDRIIDALATLLTGLTTTATRVYVDRDPDTEPLSAGELPGLTIQQHDDLASNQTIGGRVFQRSLQVEINIFSKLTTSTLVRKQLNLINQEIEVALNTDRSLAGLCKYINPGNFSTEISGETDKPEGRARLDLEVIYLYAEGTPDTAL